MITRKRLILNDGTGLSVQASSQHACTPREDNSPAYSDVEIGFLEPVSAIPDAWAKYAESSGDNWKRDSQFFSRVPASVLMDFVLEHGGIANGEIPPLAFFAEPSMSESDTDDE